MIINYPFIDGIKVYILGAEPIFARMLELELSEGGLPAVRQTEAPESQSENGEIRVFTASSEFLEANPNFHADIEFGYSDSGTGRGERYFKRPFAVDSFVRAVAELVMGGGDTTGVRSSELSQFAEEGRAVSEDRRSGGLAYNTENGRFYYDEEELALTETEQALLLLLYEKRGETVTREELLEQVWGRDEKQNVRKTNLTDVYIRYLREKLDDRFDVRLIVSVRGKGYMLR